MTSTAGVERRGASGVTLRAVTVGVVLIFFNAHWLAQPSNAAGAATVLLTYLSLFINTVFILFVLIVLNLAVRRVLRRYAFRERELLVIYVMLVIASTVGGKTSIGYLIYIIAHPFHFATAGNDWQNLFLRHVPEWFTVRDESVLRAFYDGESSFFTPEHVGAWVLPVLAWSAFVFVVYFALLCISVVLRRQFEHERLTYPITLLPLAMARSPATLL